MTATPVPALRQAIRQLAMGGSLSEPQAREAFGIVMRGEATPAQIAALLVGLRVKGETADEERCDLSRGGLPRHHGLERQVGLVGGE